MFLTIEFLVVTNYDGAAAAWQQKGCGFNSRLWVCQGFILPLPNDSWVRLLLTPVTLNSGRSGYPKWMSKGYKDCLATHLYKFNITRTQLCWMIRVSVEWVFNLSLTSLSFFFLLFRVICLCAQFEAVLQHGLRKSRGLALTAAALKQAAGFSSKTDGGTTDWSTLTYIYILFVLFSPTLVTGCCGVQGSCCTEKVRSHQVSRCCDDTCVARAAELTRQPPSCDIKLSTAVWHFCYKFVWQHRSGLAERAC